jgi:hypothetical protein
VADFDGDGLRDVAVANGGTPLDSEPDVVVLPGRGPDGLGAMVPIPGQDGASVAAADFDGDGRQDLAFGVTGAAASARRRWRTHGATAISPLGRRSRWRCRTTTRMPISSKPRT